MKNEERRIFVAKKQICPHSLSLVGSDGTKDFERKNTVQDSRKIEGEEEEEE